MSRNVRKKFAAAPAKASKRRRGSDTSSSFDLSDDDEGYSAVEDISDSEDDDEEDVAAVEEENILIEAFVRPSNSPRPQPVFMEEEEADDEDDDNDQDDNDDNDDVDLDADDTASWAGIASEVDDSQVSDFYKEATAFSSDNVERHVRFDVPDSDSDSTETEDDHADLFPDIFVAQNSLDPAFRREIEDDPDESSGSGSFWDYQGQYSEPADAFDSDAEEVVRQLSDDETPVATPKPPQSSAVASNPIPAFEEPQDLDGYESESCLYAGPVLFHMLTFLPQLMVTLLRRISQSPLFVERLAAPRSPSAKSLTRMVICPSSLSVASLVSAASTLTALTRSPLPS